MPLRFIFQFAYKLNSGTHDQIGLTLESKKEPVDCIVIDHLELPSAN